MVGRRATPCEDSDACLGSSSFFFFFLFLNKKKPMVLCLMLDFIAFRAPRCAAAIPHLACRHAETLNAMTRHKEPAPPRPW